MDPIYIRAKACLTEEEIVVLNLKYNHGKSTWEGGEITKKAHYKYLETLGRAERFIRMFMEYFKQYPDIIRPGANVTPAFKEFITTTILQRLQVKVVCQEHTTDKGYIVNAYRNQQLIKGMKALHTSSSKWDNDTYGLILEFDKWNNFRILPRDIQEPSPFKRRLKRREAQVMKTAFDIPEVSRRLLSNTFGKVTQTSLYGAIFYKEDGMIKNMRIYCDQGNKSGIIQISAYGVCLFPNITLLKEYIDLMTSYAYQEKKAAVVGQKFWPKFRHLAMQAANYTQVYKNDPTRAFYGETAIEQDFQKVQIQKRKIKKRPKVMETPQVNPTLFWVKK